MTVGTDKTRAQLKRHIARLVARRGGPVTYTRGDVSLSWDAVPGQSLFRLGEDNGGTRIERTDRSYIGDAEGLRDQLTAAGLDPDPARGDKVGDQGETFEVLAPGNEQPYRLESFGAVLRVHCKQVAA